MWAFTILYRDLATTVAKNMPYKPVPSQQNDFKASSAKHVRSSARNEHRDASDPQFHTALRPATRRNRQILRLQLRGVSQVSLDEIWDVRNDADDKQQRDEDHGRHGCCG